MECGEGHLLGLGGACKGLCGFQSTQQCELGEEVRGCFKLLGVVLQCDEVLMACIIVRELFLHVILINGEEDTGDDLGGLHGPFGGNEVCKSADKLVPRFLSLGRNLQRGQIREIGFPIENG